MFAIGGLGVVLILGIGMRIAGCVAFYSTFSSDSGWSHW